MRELLDHVRAGNGPAAIELDTERFYGHFEGDPQRYRGPGELDRLRADRDCLKAFRARVGEAKLLDIAELEAIDAEVARSEARRFGKEFVCTVRSRSSPSHSKQNTH